MNMPFKNPKEDITDIFSLIDCCSYWIDWLECTYNSDKKNSYSCREYRWYDSLIHDQPLKITAGNEIHYLTLDGICKGFIEATHLFNKTPEELMEDLDGDSADAIIQYALFRNIIYG